MGLLIQATIKNRLGLFIVRTLWVFVHHPGENLFDFVRLTEFEIAFPEKEERLIFFKVSQPDLSISGN